MERVFYVKGPNGYVAPPLPAPGAFGAMVAIATQRLRPYLPNCIPQTREEFVESYRDSRKKIYRQALESLYRKPVTKADARVKAFVKREKINFTAKADPAPRIIQPRDPRYNIEVGRYLKQLEKKIYYAIDQMFGYKVCAKGLNAHDCATMIREAWEAFGRPVGIGGDASRFDQHVSEQALRSEHADYLQCFPPSERAELGRLLSWQLRCSGVAYCGDGKVVYRNRGGRKSGDMNTSMGNVLLMCKMLYSYLHSIGMLKKVRVVNNGDDFVLFCEKRDMNRFVGLPAWFLLCGFNIVLEPPVYHLEEVSFCQTQPVFDGAEWVMCRDPRVCMDKDAVCLAPVAREAEHKRWVSAVGECGVSLTGGLPVLDAFYSSMITDKPLVHRTLRTSGMFMLAQGMARTSGDPSDAARVSFYRAFHITPSEQIAAETHIKSLGETKYGGDDADVPGALRELIGQNGGSGHTSLKRPNQISYRLTNTRYLGSDNRSHVPKTN